MAQKQGQNQGDVIRSFTLGNKEIEGKTVEFQYDRGQYSITDVVGEERSIVYKSRNAQEAYTKWNVYIGRKKERPERADRGGEERSAEDKQGRTRDNGRNEKRAERDNGRQERANNRSDRDTSRQERGNSRGRGRSNYRSNEARAERNEDRNADHASGNGGYNQGFTVAIAENGTGEKRYRRPRRRRNDHREQES